MLIKEELSDDEEYALEEKTQFYGNGLYKAHSFYDYEEEVIDNYINENKNEETFQSKLFSYILSIVSALLIKLSGKLANFATWIP